MGLPEERGLHEPVERVHAVRVEVQDVGRARRREQLLRVGERVPPLRELHEQRLGGLRREANLQDDAGDEAELALGAEVELEVRVSLVDPLHPARRRDDLEGLDVPREVAELQAVDPVPARGDPPADRGEPGARVRPEGEAVAAQDLLQRGPPDARLDVRDDPFLVDREDAPERGQVDDDPAHRGHGPAEREGSRAPRGDRDPEVVGGGHDVRDILGALRLDDRVGGRADEHPAQGLRDVRLVPRVEVELRPPPDDAGLRAQDLPERLRGRALGLRVRGHQRPELVQADRLQGGDNHPVPRRDAPATLKGESPGLLSSDSINTARDGIATYDLINVLTSDD